MATPALGFGFPATLARFADRLRAARSEIATQIVLHQDIYLMQDKSHVNRLSACRHSIQWLESLAGSLAAVVYR